MHYQFHLFFFVLYYQPFPLLLLWYTHTPNPKQLVVILDVVDQNRILVDSPAHADSGIWFGVPRHVMTLKDIEPTPVLAKVPRGARLSTLKKVC